MFLPLVVVAVLSFIPSSLARQWYDVHFATTPPGPVKQVFYELSGQLVVPRLPHEGGYFIFSALQSAADVSVAGIYENVLDGRSGQWHFANGWCCTPGFPWGASIATQHDDILNFSSKWDSVGDPHASWTNTISLDSTGQTEKTHFAIGDRVFNQALFGMQLYDVPWDFGWIEFKNIVIKSTGKDTTWCVTPISDTAKFKTIKPIAKVDTHGVTCLIGGLVLFNPSKTQSA